MLTPLDVIDTAVKVGLGAAIAAVATYIVSRQNHDHALLKAAIDEAASLLKEGALKLEKSASALNEGINAYDLFVRGRSPSPDALACLLTAYNEAKDAKALFYLIGAKELGELVMPYITTVNSIRDAVDDQLLKTPPEKDALSKHVEAIQRSRKDILEALGRTYEVIRRQP
jgi:hypothetical protein